MKEADKGYTAEIVHLTDTAKHIATNADEAAIVLTAEGAVHCCGPENCTVGVNEYYILSPGDRADFYSLPDSPSTLWVLRFGQHLLKDLADPAESLWEGFCRLPRRYMDAGHRSNMIIREMIQNILVNQIPLLSGSYGRLHVGLTVTVCLRTCLLQAPPEKAIVHPPLIMTDVFRYVRDHLTGDLSLAAIARALHFSPSYLAHMFREKAGTSLHQYVLARRLNYANVLLGQGLSVQKAAEHSGFSSPGSFIRAYRRAFGRTPGSACGARST